MGRSGFIRRRSPSPTSRSRSRSRHHYSTLTTESYHHIREQSRSRSRSRSQSRSGTRFYHSRALFHPESSRNYSDDYDLRRLISSRTHNDDYRYDRPKYDHNSDHHEPAPSNFYRYDRVDHECNNRRDGYYRRRSYRPPSLREPRNFSNPRQLDPEPSNHGYRRRYHPYSDRNHWNENNPPRPKPISDYNHRRSQRRWSDRNQQTPRRSRTIHSNHRCNLSHQDQQQYYESRTRRRRSHGPAPCEQLSSSFRRHDNRRIPAPNTTTTVNPHPPSEFDRIINSPSYSDDVSCELSPGPGLDDFNYSPPFSPSPCPSALNSPYYDPNCPRSCSPVFENSPDTSPRSSPGPAAAPTLGAGADLHAPARFSLAGRGGGGAIFFAAGRWGGEKSLARMRYRLLRDLDIGMQLRAISYTPGDSSVRVGPQSTLFRGHSTTLQHAGPQSTIFRGPPLTTQPRSHFGGASIGASIHPEAAASSSGTSRRSKFSTQETDDWVVTNDVPGGPCDGSVIPSFLGHTAYQLWNGEPRDYLTMKPAKKSLSRLHGWYARLPENAQLQIQNTGQTAIDYLDWYRSHSHPFLLPESVPSTSRIPGKNCTTYWMREMERLTRGCIDDLKKLDLGLDEEWDTRLDDVIFRHSQAP
ncbi:OLC1v1030882C1 [Oldenlandia corymbosa var. corymbosa]|uniref:OLC1v1030882C1 n=1 Tax=Oldenlandia corymbosa var. corymbosa TaxID=529605 RepID=A0AAV1CHX0_OLDCO|nr:OLC1v1030882C1 [Oldenlandia corymbosa var. corymbosa]